MATVANHGRDASGSGLKVTAMISTHHIDKSHGATLKSVGAMLVAQAAFTANDACMKLAGETLPIGETVTLRNGFAAIYILIYAAFFGGLLFPRGALGSAFSWRIVGEIFSTFLFFWALARMPLADITGLNHITPLAIIAAGAVFLGEPVGWRRWLAAFAGLIGVLLIVQPGLTTFTWAAVIALIANAFGVLRDLATRVISPAFSTLALTLVSIVAVMLAGFSFAVFEEWRIPTAREFGLLMVAASFLTLGYFFIILSLRLGDLAAVTSLRYSAVVWALVLGFLIWGHLPDVMTSAGIVIIVAAGLYALHRGRRRGSGV